MRFAQKWEKALPLSPSVNLANAESTTSNFKDSQESTVSRFHSSIFPPNRALCRSSRSRYIHLFPILGNTCSIAYTCGSVNPKDKQYQKAYKAFRERLIKARKDAGLTQGEVNNRMGRPHSFMSKCELGERRVDFVELQILARIYGKNLSFFVTSD